MKENKIDLNMKFPLDVLKCSYELLFHRKEANEKQNNEHLRPRIALVFCV